MFNDLLNALNATLQTSQCEQWSEISVLVSVGLSFLVLRSWFKFVKTTYQALGVILKYVLHGGVSKWPWTLKMVDFVCSAIVKYGNHMGMSVKPSAKGECMQLIKKIKPDIYWHFHIRLILIPVIQHFIWQLVVGAVGRKMCPKKREKMVKVWEHFRLKSAQCRGIIAKRTRRHPLG